ncbi:DUF4230 domain-containing protein [Dawidia soli]|uniref:DUF4230 domain-containing protein n=1 Tax=Dawidia soli TaxID=2782352 RepID=A0AAP2DER3_9BACT|nr:DUF4230 domain-containing protein [Dawidia soli]MBT1690719.1 DUF4230 domain-containing protein [Dawidia soli]
MFSNRKLVLLILLLITLSVTAYVLIVVIPARLAEKAYDGARQLGQDFREAFHFTPEVTVNNTVVLQQQVPILELATLSQKFQHRYEWRNTWMKSTKKIEITGTFEAKAGFDLHKKFTISIDDTVATVTLPAPQLLSLEQQHDVVFRDENGLWNWVDAADRSAAMNAYTADARRYAEQAAFVADARQAFEARIREIMKRHGLHAAIHYTPTETIERR